MKLAMTSTWRNIIEMTCMSNNDEHVFYSDTSCTFSSIPKQEGRLVLSRPVFDFEIKEGLDTSYKGPRHDWRDDGQKETIPDVTRFLDAYFVIKERAEVWKQIMGEKFSPTAFVSHHVAEAFYDCMSGGFPLYELMICRMLTKDPRITRSNYVYPCSKKYEKEPGRDHYNLQDFLDETADTEEKFQDTFKLLMDQISLPMLSAGDTVEEEKEKELELEL